MFDEWNETFGIPDKLEFSRHHSGLPMGTVATQYCTAQFFLYGAHISHYHPRDFDSPMLFMSREALFEEGKPIRGGVPICFPWFGAHPTDPSLPAHGTARIQQWELLETAEIYGDIVVRMGTLVGAFDLQYEICFGRDLTFSLEVCNASATAADFEVALHTYFQLGSIHETTVEGLESTKCIDQLTGQSRGPCEAEIRFDQETDFICQGAVNSVSIVDRKWGRRIRIQPVGSQSTIVWNPWIAKSQRMPDFGDDEYLRMCCVETANVRGQKVRLNENQHHTTGARIRLEKLD